MEKKNMSTLEDFVEIVQCLGTAIWKIPGIVQNKVSESYGTQDQGGVTIRDTIFTYIHSYWQYQYM
jgi:hypothetical protein